MRSIDRAIGAVPGVTALALSATSAEALVINPVFDSSITSLSNASTVNSPSARLRRSIARRSAIPPQSISK